MRRLRRRFVRSLLISSLTAAATLMLSGLIFRLASGRHSVPAVKPSEVVSQIHVSDRLMMAGILLLATTPVATVMALFVLWLRERAWRFAATAALVLGLIAVGLWLAGG